MARFLLLIINMKINRVIRRRQPRWFREPGTLQEQLDGIEKRLGLSEYLRTHGEWLKTKSFARGHLADDSPELKRWLYMASKRLKYAIAYGAKSRYIAFR